MECIAAEINQLLRHCMSGDDLVHLPSKTALFNTFEYLEQHALFYSIMLKSKGSIIFRNQMETMFRKSLIEHLDSINLDQDRNRDITVQFLISESVGVLEWWIIRSMPYPPSVMFEQF